MNTSLENKQFTVAQLNDLLKEMFDAAPFLDGITVIGELSNYKIYPSGHHYFSVKDAESQLRCVMFKHAAGSVKFKPENGMKVILCGSVSVYPRDGVYQLYVTKITPDGVGDLHVAFDQLKARLHQEGLFDPAKKKPLPRFPRRIAVVTSSAGAAVRDICRILGARYPLAKVIILPVRVQGAEAPPEIAAALDYANACNVADVIITGRGGGSIEDLWAFNDECVAYAIARSRIPIISAVGHEPDVTISDFVADVRASTPSNAAEIAVPDKNDLLAWLSASHSRNVSSLRRAADVRAQHLSRLSGAKVISSPLAYIDERRMTLDRLTERLASAMRRTIDLRGNRFTCLAAGLDALSPLKVLTRGYSIVKVSGKTVKKKSDVTAGDKITVAVSDGEISAVVSG
ncbi:MAG: exodeoxyribonuclease VII large subunit [Oscillospiraceae bacterium]|jgi:exodeoxyribonuclease VII large subunit|nr:exodeoxyribonuclease VII large subunit [Oscillospiraceae bacterium]